MSLKEVDNLFTPQQMSWWEKYNNSKWCIMGAIGIPLAGCSLKP